MNWGAFDLGLLIVLDAVMPPSSAVAQKLLERLSRWQGKADCGCRLATDTPRRLSLTAISAALITTATRC
jgi:hypothetical protein